MLAAKVFKGWKQLWLDANTDLQKLARALKKMMRFCLTKAWLKWREVTSARPADTLGAISLYVVPGRVIL